MKEVSSIQLEYIIQPGHKIEVRIFHPEGAWEQNWVCVCVSELIYEKNGWDEIAYWREWNYDEQDFDH